MLRKWNSVACDESDFATFFNFDLRLCLKKCDVFNIQVICFNTAYSWDFVFPSRDPNHLSWFFTNKHQSFIEHHWPFLRGIHQWPVDSTHKASATWKTFPHHNVIMGCIEKRYDDSTAFEIEINLLAPNHPFQMINHCTSILQKYPQKNISLTSSDDSKQWSNMVSTDLYELI